ncbi:MAG: hypothetical protein V3T53_14775 [Phycisphaerales bacterium]
MSIKKRGGQRAVILGLAVGLLGGGEVASAQIPCGGYEVSAVIQVAECPPFGFPPTLAEGLNEQGWMVGWFRACVIGPDVAWFWTPELGMQVIPTPAGTTYSRAVAISGSLIVGDFDNSNELGRTGFLYDVESDEFTSLGTLPGGNTSEVGGINSSGEIAGFWGDVVNGPFPLAFIWREAEMIDIHPDFGTSRSVPSDINSNSLVTGWMGSSPLTDARAFIWDEGKVTQLPEIPGGITSEGWTINNLEDVAGRGRIVDPRSGDTVKRAFAWIDGQMFLLGTLPGYPNSTATDINDDQIIVGFSQTTSGRAFVWRDGQMAALNDLIPPALDLDFSTARGINQAGQIAASATNEFGDAVAVLLTPIQGPPGDLNNDCQVGAADLLILLSSWGPCDDCRNCAADLNSDCVVGGADLLTLLANWG